jgi:hypothetical protein
MIIMQLLTTRRVSLLSGGGANNDTARPPFHAVRTFLSMGARI